jgi:hypothetical protein
MKNKKHFFKTKQTGFVLGALFLGALTNSAVKAEAQGVVVIAPAPVAVAPVVVPDDYVYYPNYGVYYNSRRHQYHYMRNNVWVSQAAPEGVSAQVLLASPSVKMDFHDAPSRHHAQMLQKYPKNWQPAGQHEGRP